MTTTLAYDPLGRLKTLTSGGVATDWLWDGDRLVAEYNAGGTLTARYLHGTGPDEPLAQIAGTRRWFLADTQGSIIAETDTAGARVGSAITYDPYGQPGSWTGPRFGYTGQMRLTATVPLWHYKARAYDPRIGRFLQTDPIGYEDSLNLYAYVGNDPVNLTDPTGLYICSVTPCPAAVAQAVGDINTALAEAITNKDWSAALDLSTVSAALGLEGDAGVYFDLGAADPSAMAQGGLAADGSTINVSTSGGLFSNDRANVAGVVAHEVRHGTDARTAGSNPATKADVLATELNAWRTEFSTVRQLQGLGVPYTQWPDHPSVSDSATVVSGFVRSGAQSSVTTWCNLPGNGVC